VVEDELEVLEEELEEELLEEVLEEVLEDEELLEEVLEEVLEEDELTEELEELSGGSCANMPRPKEGVVLPVAPATIFQFKVSPSATVTVPVSEP
jgi:hypothetical protein